MSLLARPPRGIVYPDSDGMPMAENTLQFQWVVTIECGLDTLFAHDPNVFVAGDLFWYPVEGDPKIRTAPDTLVAFGRPKGYRGSYKQWEEGGIAPQVIFEILSPGNRAGEMTRKFEFYEKYGVEEYYIYDPDDVEISGWIRRDGKLQEIPSMQGWVSPRLQIRFEITDEELRIYRPDGRIFVTFLELAKHADDVIEKFQRSEREKKQAEREKEQAEREKAQAERAKESACQEAERLRAQLKALGIEPQA